jgi:hypothetical protein
MKCNGFADDAVLQYSPCAVRAPVSVPELRSFISALDNKDVEAMNANFCCLSLLCDDFGFFDLCARVWAVC